MKIKLISTLKKELLIVEAKDEKIAWAMIFQKYGVKAVSDYTLLGKPDEIKEEDVRELVEILWNGFRNYSEDGSVGNYQRLVYKTDLESFNSALESDIYWENPLGEKPKFEYDFPEDGPSDFMYESAVDDFDISSIKWNEAQEKTFDKNRTIIFVKN